MSVNGDFRLRSYWDQRYESEGIEGEFDWFKKVRVSLPRYCPPGLAC